MKENLLDKSEIINWRMVVCFGLATLATRMFASYIFPQFDDSFITLRHARNLATGNGFVFNRGAAILGISCPLFGLLEAFLFKIRLPMPITVLILNIGLDVAVLVWGLRILAQNGGNISAFIFGIVFALSPSLARITIGDMEVNLFLTFSLFSISLFYAGKTFTAIALASITFFIREEALILVAILIALEFFQRSKLHALRLAGVSILAVIPGLAIIYYSYGSIIPQSVLIKLGWRSPTFFYPLHDLLLNDPVGIVLIPFTILGGWLVKQKRGQMQTIVIWMLLLILIYCANHSRIMPWYGEVSHFGQFILGSLGLGIILQRSTKISRLFSQNWMLYSSTLAILAIWSFIACKVGPSRVTTNIYTRLEQWGSSHSLQSATIMASDIGALGYYSDATILDLDGLVWPTELRKDPVQVVRVFKPTFLFLIRSRQSYNLMQNSVIRDSYLQTREFAQDSGVMPLQSAPDSWNQNYVLFQRVEK